MFRILRGGDILLRMGDLKFIWASQFLNATTEKGGINLQGGAMGQ